MMNNLRIKVISSPSCKRQHDGSETWRFSAVTDSNKVAQFVSRGCPVQQIAKDHYYVVSNMKVTDHGDDKVYVNIGPKTKVLHVAFPTAVVFLLFV